MTVIGEVVRLMRTAGLHRVTAVRIIANRHWLPADLVEGEMIAAGVPPIWGFATKLEAEWLEAEHPEAFEGG